MANNNYRVFLYQPEAVSVTAANAGSYFLGELLVDNLDISIKLQDISTVNFTMPRLINNTINTRIDEVLDGYVVELWYGDLSGTLNQDYYKYRFTIYTTPLNFSDNKFLHSYTGYSLEALTELKMLVSWPGIEISDFYRKVSYNNNGTTPKFLEPKDTVTTGNFEYTITTSGSGSDYITLTPTNATATDIDIFIYEVRQRLSTGDIVSESEAGLIPYTGTGPDDAGFKNGYYFLTISGGYVTEIDIALPDNYTSFNGQSVNSQLLFFKLYDNPLSRRYAIGITTNAEQANDMYMDLAHDVAEGNPTDYDDFNFQTQKFYSKNGLTLKQVLLGKEDTSANTVTADGLLYNTGFTLGTIDNSLNNQYRSNLEFNNVSRYAAIKNLAESFDAIAIYDTVANTVSFYPENIYGSENGLIIRYGAYLKALNKEIDASKIITNAIGLGKDNITVALVNPTGLNYWEDYSYYLDDYYISSAAQIGAITESGTLGITFSYVDASGYSSRWMSSSLAEKVAKWQYTRDWFHTILTGEYNPTSFSSTITQFYNLYEDRLEAIRLLVKQETEYYTSLKKEVKYEAFKNYYDKLSKDNPGNTTYSNKLTYYTTQLTNAQTINAALLSDLNDARDDIFDEDTAGSYAAKMVVLQGFLQKDSGARSINLDSLRPFQRETVVNDSSIDDEKDLLDIVKTHVDENKEPKVTISIDVADILAAQEAQEDWKKVKVGDKINIYLNEFNVDVVAQIREINVNFEEHSLSFVISTVRNYNKGFGNFVLKTIRNLYNSNNNNVGYEIDGNRYSKKTARNVNEVLENGINAGDTKVTSGLQDDAGNPGTQINGSGTSTSSIASVDDLTESVTSYVSSETQGVIITDGKILSYHNYTSPTTYTSEVEISADTGFIIRKNSGGTSVKQVYIDTSGNASFAGSLVAPSGTIGGFTINASDLTATNFKLASGSNPYLYFGSDATPVYGDEGIFAGMSSTDSKFSLVSGSTFLKYDTSSSAEYDLIISGNAKVGPLYVGNAGSNTSTLTSASGLTYYTGDSVQIVNGVNFEFVVFNLTDKSGQEITGGTVSLSAYSASNIIADITLYDAINGGGNTLANFVTDDLSTIGGIGGFIFSSNIRNVKSIRVGVTSINILATWTLPIANISITAYKPSIQINNFTVNSSGETTSSKLTINTSATIGRDSITILPHTVGTTYKNMVLSTPTGGLTLSRTVRLPDASGTIALNDAAQTFSAIKTFSAEPVLTAGAIFGSAADAANSIEITSSGNIIFEGSSADGNETILTASNATADRTITLPDATGTVALSTPVYTSGPTLVTGSTDTWTAFALGYTPALGDRFLVVVGSGSTNTAMEKAGVIVEYGTFSSTAGMALISYDSWSSVASFVITASKRYCQWRINGTSMELRHPTQLTLSGTITPSALTTFYVWGIYKL
jgi:hypothetical protein